MFLLVPTTTVTVLVFAALIGLLWLSTVPLTSGLIALMFGTRHIGMLFGVVFLSHQIGAFAGALLGGSVYEATGSYDTMWVLCIVLGVAAALVHLPIRERAAQVAPPRRRHECPAPRAGDPARGRARRRDAARAALRHERGDGRWRGVGRAEAHLPAALRRAAPGT